ncbi:MAG: hypothetical protein WCJ30_18365, partial [Deltaproteobacteria bacterium]
PSTALRTAPPAAGGPDAGVLSPGLSPAPQVPPGPAAPAPTADPPAARAQATPNAHGSARTPSTSAHVRPPAQPVPAGPAAQLAPGYFAPVVAAPQPLPAPRRVVPQQRVDPVVQQANSAATQLAYNAQQVGYADPRRARRLLNFSNDIRSRVERVHELDLEAAQNDSVNPRRAAHARDVAARRREDLQRLVDRALRE